MTSSQPAAPGQAPRSGSRKALWILLGAFGAIALIIVAFAAFGMIFFVRNVSMEQATTAEADRSFETVRAQFKDKPIIAIDGRENVTLQRRPPNAPPPVKPTVLHIMAHDPEDERVVNVKVPFWLLRLGREKIRLGSGGDFQLEDLKITAQELERYGPALLLDHRDRSGTRVLVWTQ
jgi:hypothetical protein